jgi:DNA-directed RNA polymerase specialized sigma subunit
MPSTTRKTACKVAEYPSTMRRHLLASKIVDGPAIAAVWGRYLADRNAADFSTLCDHYTRIVWIEANRIHSQAPHLFGGPVDDSVSDGLLGMIQQIRITESFAPFYTFSKLRNAIRRAIWAEALSRSWPGRHHSEKMLTIRRIRAELTRETGRVPDRDEIIVRLSRQVANPNIYIPAIDDAGRVISNPSQWGGLTAKGELENAMKKIADERSANPIDAILGGESVRLAMKRMKGVDRIIFRMLLAGHDQFEIAEKMKLSRGTIHNRLNGLLWTARCNAELAAYLGVEPDAAPPQRKADSHWPTFRAEPARKVG